MSTQEPRVPPVRHFDPEMRREAEEAAARTGYSNDSPRRAVFACGYIDGRNGGRNEVLIFGAYKEVYSTGFDVGEQARAHAAMLANAIPKRMTLAAIEDIDKELMKQHCDDCGAPLTDGVCPNFPECSGICEHCGARLDFADIDKPVCINDECPRWGPKVAE